MKQKLQLHRPAMAALFALVASSTAPVFAQDVTAAPPPPVINAPPPMVSAPPPSVTVTPPPTATVAPPPAARPAPPPAERARTVVRTAHVTSHTTARPAAAAPVRRAAPAESAPVPATPPPVAGPAPVAPVVAAPAAPVAGASGTVAPQNGFISYWPWAAAAGVLLIAALTLLALRRRRAAYEEEAYYEEPYYEAEAAPEPAFQRAPVEAVVPVAAASASEDVSVAEPGSADMEALAAGSEPAPGRPWLEFLMRPIRAGTSRDDAVVAFELTVGNTGTVEARDVRISTWMVAGGQGTEMERSLIDPPADAQVSEVDISAGDGARVEAELAVPKGDMSGSVMPVVVADARYRLPDGSEGRTHASFEVGRSGDGEIEPFLLDRTGITENVEARLHGEPERV